MNYTPKQLHILRLIYDYQHAHGFSPTYAELAKQLSVSTITVFEHLEALERKGAIRRRRHQARSVEIIEPHFLREYGGKRTLPLRGCITAGKPIEAVETHEEIPIADVFGSASNTYVLKVKGDSMVDDHIVDGDLIVVEGRDHAADGEIVVALPPNGQATLKRYFKENDKIRLQPMNPTLPPLFFDSVQIRGIFKGLVRKCK